MKSNARLTVICIAIATFLYGLSAESAVKPSLDRVNVISVPRGPVDVRVIGIEATVGGSAAWTAEVTSQTAWLKLDNASGSFPGSLAARINPSGLAAGVYSGNIRISSGASIADLPVLLQIDPLNITQLRADLLRPQLYALNDAGTSGSVLVVSAADASITKVIPVGSGPRDSSFSPDGAFLYTADCISRTISKIDLSSLVRSSQRAVSLHSTQGNSRFSLAAGKNGIIYYTDGASVPALKVINFDSGTESAGYQHTGGLGIDSLWYDPLLERLYGNERYSFNTITSKIFALDAKASPPALIKRSNDPFNIGISDGDSILRVGIDRKRMFALLGRFDLPSMEPFGAILATETRALSAYGHLRTDIGGILDAATNSMIAAFPVGFPNAPRYSDFTINQDAVVFFNRVTGAFEILRIPEAAKPPRIALVPSPADGGVVDYDSPLLSWTALPMVEGYRVFIGTDAAAVVAASAGMPEDRGVVQGLEYLMASPYPLGTVFYWRVDAIRGGQAVPGVVSQSRISPFRFAPGAYARRLPQGTGPQPFEVAMLGGNNEMLGWSASSPQPWITLDAPSGGPGSKLTGMIDPSGLVSGTHTGSVIVAAGGATQEFRISLDIHALQLVKLAADPTRPLVYGLHTGNPVFDESQLLAIDAATGVIKKVVAVGRNATDFDVDPVAGRIYLNNLNFPVIRVVELAGFSQLAPLPAPTDISGVKSDQDGRLFVQRSTGFGRGFQILDAGTGAVLGDSGSNSAEGDRAALDVANGLYYVAQVSSTFDLNVFDIRTNPPTRVQYIKQIAEVKQPPLLSADGKYLFWQKRSYRTPSTPWALMPGDVISTNPDGEIAVGSNAIWWSDSGEVAATLPFSSAVSAIDATGRHLVLFNPAGGRVSSIALATLVALPGPRPIPGSTIPRDEFKGLSWPAVPGATGYQVYFGTAQQTVNAATPGSPVHLGTVTGNRFDFTSPPAWGYRFYWRIDAITATGVVGGGVRHFDIPFPPLGEPVIFRASSLSWNNITLDEGAALVAADDDSNISSYTINPANGIVSIDQNLRGNITLYNEKVSCGQGWIFASEQAEIFEPITKPTTLAVWSRDVFSGHWRQRKPLTLTPPGALGSSILALASEGGHLLAGLSPPSSSSPRRVIASLEWPQPRVIGSFQASDGFNGDTFGTSIAMDGNRALIGAPGSTSRVGSAYLFEFLPASSSWVQRVKLQPTTSSRRYAGGVVDIEGNNAVLGPGNLNISSSTRTIYIYRSISNRWSLIQEINNPSTNSANFGYGDAVALHGDLLFVSEPYFAGTEPSQGRLHVYHMENNLWVPGAPILPPPGSRGFGLSLVVRDGVLYVGSDNEIHTYRLRVASNRAPRFDNPPPARLVSGQPANVAITATDSDGADGLVIAARSLPAGLTLVNHGQGRATLGGTPSGAAGSRVFAQWSVSDPAGATTYQSCLIDLIAAGDRPVFKKQPESAGVGEGQSVDLTASVGDDEMVSWQWFKDNQAIAGATRPYHVIENASMNDAGGYRVNATNEAGTSQSISAILRVRPPDLDGGSWSTWGNTSARTGHHPATLDRVTFVPAWSRKLADIGRLEQPVIAGNRVFTGVSGWRSSPLEALDLFTGATLWNAPLQGSGSPGEKLPPFSERGAPTWFGGRLHLLTEADNAKSLNCLDAATGNLVWTSPAFSLGSFPAVTHSGIFYGDLHASESDGTPRFQNMGSFYSVKQGRVFTFSGGAFKEHRPADGGVLWDLKPESASSSAGGYLALGEDCALAIHERTLWCFDTKTRELRWRNTGQFDGTPAVHNGMAYAIHPGGVTAYSLADGAAAASYPTPNKPINNGVGGQQPLLLNDHMLVSNVNSTWVFRLATGKLVQTIPTGGGILAYSQGHLLVTGGDGSTFSGNTLHAYRANSSPKFSSEVPTSTVANASAEPMTIRLGSFASDADAGDLLTWSIVSVSRPEIFRTLEIHPQTGDLTVVFNPWQSGSSAVRLEMKDSVGNITEHTITLTVPQHPEPQLELAAKLVLNRQTGLYEHAITVTNSGARAIAGFDLKISGLPAGVTVNNASARDGDDWIIHHRQPIAAGAKVSLVIEYYTPVRGTVLNPQVTANIITEPETHPAAPGGGLAVESCKVLDDKSVMIEFATKPGSLYEIHYSDDAVSWKLSPVRVRAAGNRVQWIDSGPPRTDASPSGKPARFYRVRELPQS